FQREGLPVIPLKGPALAETLYRDPGVRPFTDLDLLIRGDDLPGALQLLSALGYRHLRTGPPLEFELAWRHAASFVNAEPRGDHLPVDLHWQLLDYPAGAPAAAIDHREIWGQAIEVDGWGQRRLELCPEDLLIYLALHWAVHHACSGLIWQLDLALLLRRHGGSLDWEGVGERARRWRVSGGLHFALQVVQERLNVGPPSRLMADLRPRGPRRWALEWLGHRSDEELERLDYLVPVLLLERSWDVLRLLARSLFPAARWVRARYGQQSLVGAYAAHYGRIAKVCLRTIRAWGQA
ncbi:MAG: nucleotidyltransferase family protein, partial [candidate division NC10 bacterium]